MYKNMQTELDIYLKCNNDRKVLQNFDGIVRYFFLCNLKISIEEELR